VALRIKDRVKQGTTTTGAGTINLDVSFSSSGFQDFSVLGNGTETYYAIEEGSNFEIGLGTYNSNTLTRSTVLDSSNGGAKISLNGNANVFVTYPADKAVFTDADNNATVTGLIVGQTGVKFNDGTIQTTAFVGSVGGYDFTVSDGSNSEVISSGNTVIWTGVGNTTVSYDTGSNTFSVSGTDQDLSSYATQTYVNDASGQLQAQISTNDTDISNLSGLVSSNSTDIATVSGLTVTNANNISSNDTDINTVSGLTVTNATNISNNSTDISTVSGLTVTNANDIDTVSGLTVTNANNISTNSTDIDTVSGLTVTNAGNISTNSTDIATVSGLTVTNANNISTNSTDIDTVSGLLYNSWTVTDGSNSEAISAGNQVKFTGEGNTTVSYDIGTNTVSISGTAAGGGGGYDFTVSDGSNSEVVASGDSVTWTGLGNNTVTYDSGSNTFSISGTDQDLSSYATVSNLASTGATNAASAATNASNITTVSGLTVTNATDIGTVSGITVTNATDIDTVSGLLYNSWTASDGSNSEAISGGDEVKFTGTGATTVSYNTGSNTFTINTPSSEAGYEGWTATDGNATSEIANGNDVKITGAGNVTVSFVSGSPNVFTVSGADQDLSSYATEAYVTGVSGHLQGQIDTNSTDISTNSSNITTVSGLTDTNATNIDTVSGLTVTNATDISTVSGLTVTNATDIDTVSGLTVTNATDISTVSGLTVTNATDIDTVSGLTVTNATDIDTVSGLTVTNATDIDTVSGLTVTNATDIDTVSGLTVTNATDIGTVSGLTVTNATDIDTVSGLLYNNWVLQGDGATTTDIDSAETVQFTGAGNVSISLGGTDNRTVTISGNDVSNTYTAGTGLILVGDTDFNVSGIDTTLLQGTITNAQLAGDIANAKLVNDSVSYGGVSLDLGQNDDTPAFDLSDATNYPTSSLVGTITNAQLAGSITNAKLVNHSVTVTAGSGLSNGGEVDLGASISVDITPGGVTAAMLNTDVTLDEITDHGATTTNNITVGMINTSGVRTPISSGAGGATATFDLSTASTFTHTLAANSTTTLAVSNVTAGQKFIIRVEQNSAGTGLVNFFSTIRWAGGTAPTLTATTGQIDTFGFLTTTSGNYEGFIIGQNI